MNCTSAPFTSEGTFEAIIPRLRELHEFGVNAIELMPIGQFPGNRNWGYDGVFPYAAQNSYGGSEGLKKLVDAAHQQGISIILDVIYNHFGPEGELVSDLWIPTSRKLSNGLGVMQLTLIRNTVTACVTTLFENALYWFEKFHIDALRLDASDTYMISVSNTSCKN
jgi:maltooligosyltrehalose trehalohydrolase